MKKDYAILRWIALIPSCIACYIIVPMIVYFFMSRFTEESSDFSNIYAEGSFHVIEGFSFMFPALSIMLDRQKRIASWISFSVYILVTALNVFVAYQTDGEFHYVRVGLNLFGALAVLAACQSSPVKQLK